MIDPLHFDVEEGLSNVLGGVELVDVAMHRQAISLGAGHVVDLFELERRVVPLV